MQIAAVKVILIVILLGVFVLGMASTASGMDPRQSLLLAHEGMGYAEPVLSPWFNDQVSWLPVAMAGLPFGRASGGVLGDYFYVFGAVGEPRAQAYNWATDHWQLSTQPPWGDCNWCGVATDEAVYLIGRYCDYAFGEEVQKFIPLNNGPTGYWETIAAYPLAAAGIAAAWDGGNYIYAAGGSDLTEIYSNVYRYDIAADTWTQIAPLPIPMTYHGGAFVGGRFHVMGGVQDFSAAHYAYDPVTDTWSDRAPMPVPNYFALFNLTHNGFHIISVGGGGGYDIWPATDAVQIYDPVADTWMQETPLPEVFGLNAAAFMPDTSVASAGGLDGIAFVQQTFKGAGFPSGVTGIINQNNGDIAQPLAFEFHPAHPNPFNPVTHLSFTTPVATQVQLVIFDASGRRVAELLNENVPAGYHQVVFGVSTLSSGLYFARLTAADFRRTEKLLLLR